MRPDGRGGGAYPRESSVERRMSRAGDTKDPPSPRLPPTPKAMADKMEGRPACAKASACVNRRRQGYGGQESTMAGQVGAAGPPASKALRRGGREEWKDHLRWAEWSDGIRPGQIRS